MDTLRAWRSVSPFLAARKGHAPTFTAGDLVALAAISDLVGPFGVRIGAVAEQVEAILIACHDQSWLALADCAIVIEKDGGRLTRLDASRSAASGAAWVIPCRPLIAGLQATLHAAEAEVQGRLQFPPVAVGAR